MLLHGGLGSLDLPVTVQVPAPRRLRGAGLAAQQDPVDRPLHSLVRIDALHASAANGLRSDPTGRLTDDLRQVDLVDDVPSQTHQVDPVDHRLDLHPIGDLVDVDPGQDGLEVDGGHDAVDVNGGHDRREVDAVEHHPGQVQAANDSPDVDPRDQRVQVDPLPHHRGQVEEVDHRGKLPFHLVDVHPHQAAVPNADSPRL